ncbi:hypothetical protein MHBO_000280 [Bonamia ostreae]|uniref:RRM domain-containing protein n=1 Tax=Bonamia ostreae TaxID=126728 RepID=A0ABV2AFY4_9EUKA
MATTDPNDTKSTLFVGGFPPEVNEKVLHAAFITFGEIKYIQIPMHPLTEKHKGYGFLEFEEAADAADAMANMDRSEIYGRVVHVNYAKPVKFTDKNKPVWAQTNEYIDILKKTQEEQHEKERKKQEDFMKQLEEQAKLPVGPSSEK